MKLIIAGGRDYDLTASDFLRLNKINSLVTVTEVVSGGADGADGGGERWADSMDIPVKVFRADWKQFGKGAGPRSNEEMAAYADALMAFPGGEGTSNMIQHARNRGLIVYGWAAA